MQLVFPWLQFGLCVVAIGLAGPVLTRSGQAIARLTGMSASWVGLIMLATATSLPELFTGISAVTVADAPNIAMGDALGSCIFNLVMVAVLDTLSRDTPVWRRIDQGHILTASFGIILISFVGVLVLIARSDLNFRIAHVSVYSPLLVVLYVVAMRAALWDGPPLTDRHYYAAGIEEERTDGESGDQHSGRRSWQEQLQHRRP
ncbi:hypothetical protein GCM10011349_12410 [Novosphingobium indicum]|jgi:cation:H+ antiporter|uniref:Sodium/calcium exchanger membrane region domain-containing protein n=1 Tax=Novosphingobium indicum TaxID=462949 RepID=A0ABQ2JHE5_9SPHN|nr:hypothetical protein [Novosphingobium indicum]GGN45886.1 hypothetical protein GCM10011349_12410 [Novosphingobium indicum]